MPKEIKKNIETVITKVLQHENFSQNMEVSVSIVSNDEIQRINREQREKNQVTDVLSFPLLEVEEIRQMKEEGQRNQLFQNPETGEIMLGDIVISIEKAKEQALQYNHSLMREICFLITHSMLHLLGYDHMTEEEDLEMRKKQSTVLKEVGIVR